MKKFSKNSANKVSKTEEAAQQANEKSEHDIKHDEFEAEIEGRSLEIDLEASTAANYKADSKTIELVIHNIQKLPKRVKVDGKKAMSNYNETYKTLTLNVVWDTKKDKQIRIKLK